MRYNFPPEATRIRTIFEFECIMCAKRFIRELWGPELLYPEIPVSDGKQWRKVGRGWVCPDHCIEIDGAPLEFDSVA